MDNPIQGLYIYFDKKGVLQFHAPDGPMDVFVVDKKSSTIKERYHCRDYEDRQLNMEAGDELFITHLAMTNDVAGKTLQDQCEHWPERFDPLLAKAYSSQTFWCCGHRVSYDRVLKQAEATTSEMDPDL